MAKSVWKMNEKHETFVNEVKAAGAKGVTLFELKLAGKEFASGSVNTLVTKGVVATLPNKREYVCEVVYNGVVVGSTKKTGVVFVMPEYAEGSAETEPEAE